MKLLAINACDALGDSAFCEELLASGADVVFVSEAFAEDASEAEVESVRSNLQGYDVAFALYEDEDGRKDRHVMAMLVRRELVGRIRMEKMWLGSRYSIMATVDDTYKVMGVHLDDRSWDGRNEQVRFLLAHIDGSPAVVFGDLNETWPGTWLGRLLQMAIIQRLIGRLPVGQPGTNQSRLARFGSLLSRLAMQVAGRVIDTMCESGFEEVDASRRPTMYLHKRVRIPVVQLDHIMVRRLRATNFRRVRLQRTDHIGVMADID